MSDTPLPFGASRKLYEQRKREMGVYSNPQTNQMGVQERVNRILSGPTDSLSEKDMEFIRSIHRRGQTELSPKQSKWFRDIEQRALSAS